jgi:hypothetical protein
MDWEHDLGPQSTKLRRAKAHGSAISRREVSHNRKSQTAAGVILR